MGKQQSLTDKAYDYIKEQILLQNLVPGSPLNEIQLSEELSMSRTPIRDAIKRLELDGLVEVLPRRGTFIKHLTPTEIIMYYEIAEGLEGVLAYNIALRVKKGDLDKEALAPIKQYVDDMDEYYEKNLPKQWVTSDAAFHEQLYQYCNNPILVEYLSRVRIHFNSVQWFITPKYVNRKLSNEEHRELYEHLVAGNPEMARETAQRQRARIRDEIRKYCEL